MLIVHPKPFAFESWDELSGFKNHTQKISRRSRYFFLSVDEKLPRENKNKMILLQFTRS